MLCLLYIYTYNFLDTLTINTLIKYIDAVVTRKLICKYHLLIENYFNPNIRDRIATVNTGLKRKHSANEGKSEMGRDGTMGQRTGEMGTEDGRMGE